MSRTTAAWACLWVLCIASVVSAQTSVDSPLADKTPTGPPSVTAPDRIGEPLPAEAGAASELSIGVKAPDFALDGSSGHPVRLADLGGRWAVMLFADDRETLLPMRAIVDTLQRAGIALYGVCEGDAPALTTFARHAQLPFPLLADLDADVSRAYGMYDLANEAIEPGIAILDAKGTLRMTLSGQALHPSEVLALVLHTTTGS